MSEPSENQFVCTGCGRRYAWKESLAGRRVKCKCGHVMEVPSAPPTSEEPETYALGDDEGDMSSFDFSSLPPPPPESESAPVIAAAAEQEDQPPPPRRAKPEKPSPSASRSAQRSVGRGAAATIPYAGSSQNRRDAALAHEQDTLIKQAIIVVLAMGLVAGAVFGIRFLAGAGKSGAPAPGNDAELARMIEDEGGTEARQWLEARPGRMLSGMTPSQANFRIDEWYKMGAVKVYAFGGITSMTVVLEMPKDPAKRKELIDWTNKWNGDLAGPKMVTDVGQKYLLVRLRL